MTAIGLRRIVASALAEVGTDAAMARPPKGRPRETRWLGTERGLGIRHYASGRSVYVVQTRMGGRQRTVTIGLASVISRHQAAMVARRVVAHAEVGHDPATERARIRSAPRFDDFLEEYWRSCSPRWKASTAVTQGIYRANYLDDAFPGAFIDALGEAEVTRWFADLNNRTGPGAANRVISILRHMFSRAESWGYRPENSNPCRAVRLNRNRVCERFLDTEELARVGRVLAELRADDTDRVRPVVATAILLLVLTGCRLREVLGLHWGDVRGRRLLLRDSKTGPRTVWLGDEARALLESLPRWKHNPWCFWNSRFQRPIRNIDHYWREMQEKAGLRGVRLHDLRHTFASHAAMNSETLPMIGRLLGHAKPQSTARYAHLDDAHILNAAEQIGTALEKLLG